MSLKQATPAASPERPWLLAIGLRTLTLSRAPAVVGAALAVVLFCACGIQIEVNLFNDAIGCSSPMSSETMRPRPRRRAIGSSASARWGVALILARRSPSHGLFSFASLGDNVRSEI